MLTFHVQFIVKVKNEWSLFLLPVCLNGMDRDSLTCFIPLYAVVVEAEELYQQWHEVSKDTYTNCDDILNQRNMLYPSLRS